MLKVKRLAIAGVPLPPLVNLTSGFPAAYDQGQIGSCTGNGCAGAVAFDRRKQSMPLLVPSRLMLYYDARALEGTTKQDAGASIRDVVKGLTSYGYCPESLWPYVESNVCTKPSAAAYADAKTREQVVYQRVTQNAGPAATQTALKVTLASGLPVVFGFAVYPSFESDAVAASGVVPMPIAADKKAGSVGGHCVALCGYDDATSRFLCRNSWGAAWGLKGYFTMPYAYVTNSGLASDFWVVNHLSI
jgi:C1A family cysteine protease